MNNFAKGLLLALVVAAPVAISAPSVLAKSATTQKPAATHQQRVARNTTHKASAKKNASVSANKRNAHAMKPAMKK